MGSLIYKKTGDSIELESAGFAGGRFVARETEDDGKTMVPMFHVTDHLGNVRTVVDITDIQRWTTPDPLAEKYYNLSPYAFCNNNPVNFVDPDGMDIWEIDKSGVVRWIEESDEHRLYSVDSLGNRSVDYIEVKDRNILDALTDKKGVASYTSSSNIDDFFKVFLFASDNSNVEWVVHRGQDNRYTIGTMHDDESAGTWEDYGIKKPIASIHSHPNIPNNVLDETFSMGFIRVGQGKAQFIYGKDWYNAREDIKNNNTKARKSYVYFPKSKNIYYLSYNGPKLIKK